MHANSRLPVFESLRQVIRGSRGFLALIFAFTLLAAGWTTNAKAAPGCCQTECSASVEAAQSALLQAGSGTLDLAVPDGATLRLPEWRVAAGTVIDLRQPSAESTLTVVVDGNEPVEIAGAIRTNGRLVVTSRAGFKVAPSASFDAAAVTLNQSAEAAVLSEVLGSIRAQDIRIHAGVNGTLRLGGTLDATSLAAKGGAIRATGRLITVTSGTKIDASGALGGGEVFIGGGYQGKDATLFNADRTVIEKDVQLAANALQAGDGGRIIVWSDYDTSFHGLAVARGGERSGNGGFVEVSGKGVLAYRGLADLRSRHASGQNGTLLLDPASITIAAASPDINGNSGGLDITGVNDLNNATTTPVGFTTANSIITATALNALLTGSNSVTLAATGGITVNAAVTGAGTSSLTLNAGTTISLAAAVNVPTVTLIHGGALTGTGLVTATTLNLQGLGAVGTSGAKLTTAAGTLVLNKAAGAGNVFATQTAALAIQGTTGGNLDVTAGGFTQVATLSVTGTSSFTAGVAVITLNLANTFTGAVSLSNSGANNVAVTTSGALLLGTSSVGSGTLTLTGVGITQSGVTTLTQAAAAGAATFNAGAGVITLGSANSFTGAVALSNSGANNVAVTTSGALLLGTSSVGSGTLTLNGVGITQSGVTTLTQAAAAGAATFNAGAGVITLGSANSFTGAVALNNSGAFNVAVVNNALPLVLGTSSVGTGTLGITAGGHITQTGAITQAASAGAMTLTVTAATSDILLSQANSFTATPVITSNGNVRDINLRNTSTTALVPTMPAGLRSLTLTHNGAAVALPTLTLGATGNLAVTAGGAITQPTGVLTVPGTSSFTTGAFAITLGAANVFTNAVSLSNSGANNVAVTNGAIPLVLGTSSVGSGTLTLTGVGITQSGAITQAAAAGTATFNAGAGVITLGSANSFTGAVALNNSGAFDVAVTNGGALLLGTSSVGSGTLTLTGVGITQSGVTTLTQAAAAGTATFNAGAGVITLGNANSFTGAVALNNSGAFNVAVTNGAIPLVLGTSSVGSGSLTLTGVGVSQGATTITQAGAGAVTINAGAAAIALGNNNAITGTVALTNSGALNVALKTTGALNLGAVNVGSGTLTLTGVGITQAVSTAITQAAGAGAATFSAGVGVITLDKVNTFTGPVSLANSSTNAAVLNNSSALQLGTSGLGGALTVTAGTNGITQTGVLTVAGATSLSATALYDINLPLANSFGGAVSIPAAKNVTLNSSGALLLGICGVNGTFAITSAGPVTQNNLLTVTGLTTLTASGNNITLGLGNIFSSVTIVSGNTVSVANGSSALTLVGATVSGGLSAAATGTLTVNSAITNSGSGNVSLVANGASPAFINANVSSGAGGVTINANSVTFTGGPLLTATGGAVSLTSSGAATDLALPAINATGLTVSANGVITQTGVLAVGGATSLAAGAFKDITLSQSNNLGTVAITSGYNVALNNATALALGASTVTGTLTVTTNGPISQSGAITAIGAASFSAGSGSNIMLNTSTNTFGTVSFPTAASVALTNSGALTLGTSYISGNLTLIASGAILQTGAVTVIGATSLNAGFGAITLTMPGNNFSGGLALAGSSANVTVSGAVDLATSNLTGSLTVSAGGNVTNSGVLTIGGNVSITTIGSITLNPANVITGTVTFNTPGSADYVVSNPAGPVNLPAMTVNTLTVIAGGPVTQSGPLTVTGAANIKTVNNTGAAITLNYDANSFGSIVVQVRNASDTADANAAIEIHQLGTVSMVLAGARTLGSLTLVSNGGAITQTSAAVVGGALSISAGAGAITLADAANALSGAVTIANTGSANVTLSTQSALSLGNVSVGTGVLTLTANTAAANAAGLSQVAGTAITQAAAGGAVTLNAGAGALTLANAGNSFSGPVSVTSSGVGNNATLAAAGATTLGTSSVGNNLTVSVGGALGQAASSVITVPGLLSLATTSGDIVIGESANYLNQVALVAPANASLRDIDGYSLQATTVIGDLTALAGGAITQGGTLNVTGTATFKTLNSFGSGITLADNANKFGKIAAFVRDSGDAADANANIVIQGANGIVLAGVRTQASLSVVSNNMPISQTAPLVVGGTTTLSSGIATVQLNGAGNEFNQVTFVSAALASLRDSNDIIVTGVVTGTVIISAPGTINTTGLTAAGISFGKNDQSITFGQLAGKTYGDAPFTVAATATSGQAVTFSLVSGPATLAGNTITLTGAGTVVVRASQAGNANYNAATNVDQAFTVTAPQTAGTYFGQFGGNDAVGRFGLLVRANGTGVFLAYLPGLRVGMLNQSVPIDALGNFTVTFDAVAAATAVEGASNAPRTVTLQGSVRGGTVVGSVSQLGLALAGNAAATTGSSQAAAGLYQAAQVGTAAGQVYTLVAADNQAFVYTTNGQQASGGAATVAFGNVVTATLADNSRITLTVDGAAGTATGTVTSASGTSTQVAGTKDTVAAVQRLINISTRGRTTNTGDITTLISGFVINGSAPKRVLIRTIGPTLSALSVPGFLTTPRLTVFSGQNQILTNNRWDASIAGLMASVGAFALPAGSADAAVVMTLVPGPYTVQASGGDGVVLNEVYELLETGEVPAARRLVNISTRGSVGSGGNILIAGFVIDGPAPKKVLIRAAGPGLALIGVPAASALPNPRLRLFSGSTVIKENDDWFRDADASLISAAAADSGAFAFGAQSLDSAMVVFLNPGPYTAQIDSVDARTGVALVEVYEIQ